MVSIQKLHHYAPRVNKNTKVTNIKYKIVKTNRIRCKHFSMNKKIENRLIQITHKQHSSWNRSSSNPI